MPIFLSHSNLFGRAGIRAQLLTDQVGTTDGEWLGLEGFFPVSIELNGMNADTLQIRGSNLPTQPLNTAHGFQLGVDITSDQLVVLLAPVRWIKVRVTAAGTGTINAYLEGRT